MSIALLVITDGRDDYLVQCVASLHQLTGDITERWMFDDTGDDDYRAHLAVAYPEFRHINGGPRRGFGGAIRSAWSHLATSDAQWIFHVEQDFTFPRTVDLGAMADVMMRHPRLAQMALRRQPWNAAEHAAGGVIEQHPDAYAQHHDGDQVWLEHRQFFTTNPSLYRRSLCGTGWPNGKRSEGEFTHHLLRDGCLGIPGDAVSFGYWGARSDPPWVEHIGHQRHGTGY